MQCGPRWTVRSGSRPSTTRKGFIGACRADALAARILGSTAETGDIDWQPKPGNVQVQLVIDLQTLRGEVDRHCLLTGSPSPRDRS